MKTVHLNLNKDWYFFDSQQFRPINRKQNFINGDLLYHNSQFYLVHHKKKIVPISWPHAGKILYSRTGNKGSRGRTITVSKLKQIFAFTINAEEEVQTSVKPTNYPFNMPDDEPLPESSQDDSKKLSPPEKIARKLLLECVRSYDRLEIRGNFIMIHSKNHRLYRISMRTRQTYDIKSNPICVTPIYGCSLPHFDVLLAKALTIAYAPHLIRTLH